MKEFNLISFNIFEIVYVIIMKQINFEEYKQELLNAKVSPEEIFDFNLSPICGLYQRYFDWCVDNINDYSEKFGIEPAYFYFWDTHEINAQAGFVKGKYIIRFSKSYMEILHEKIGRRGQFFGKTDWSAFYNLQKLLKNSLEYLMFQASTIFTFYHEFSHLVQKQGGAFLMNEYPNKNEFTFDRHLLEYDADLNGSQFVCVYMLQFFEENLPKEYRTDANLNRLLYIGISSIVITFLMFLYGEMYPFKPENLNTEFYLKKSTHPHTFVRAKYIIEHYVRIAKANGAKIDFKDTANNVSIICNEFFKESNIFIDFKNGILNNFKEIDSYVNELDKVQKASPLCIRHKIKLFGFI